ncbi:MAG: hypothetical protein JWP74_170 [Marmoricola sp.]|nr:hypothetical protein [Marmoricola sp.]
MAGPTWYEILGVEGSATPAEIKAAWRDATDKFEPGTGAGQFRLFNEAADVLLDPAKRAVYDAELGGSAVVTPDVIEPDDELEAEVVARSEERPDPAEPHTESGAPAYDEPPPYDPAATVGGTPWHLLLPVALVSVLAVASLVLTAILAVHVHHRVQEANGAADASAVAERALTAVLSYDYQHMAADSDRSAKFLTPSYRKEYLKTFALLTVGPNGSPGGAVKTKAVVTADVLSSGIVDEDKNQVRVLVFVNQSSVKGTGQPAIFQNRVVATMVKSGDEWLVNDIQSY